jgi:hypothetical protein
MIRRQWNTLRVGHHVLVHDETRPGQPLVPGRVTMVRAASGSNDVAIRIRSARGPSREVHPPRLAVHLEDLDPDQRCWRCEARHDEALRPRRKAPTAGTTK